jgi:hypothetical protein
MIVVSSQVYGDPELRCLADLEGQSTADPPIVLLVAASVL